MTKPTVSSQQIQRISDNYTVRLSQDSRYVTTLYTNYDMHSGIANVVMYPIETLESDRYFAFDGKEYKIKAEFDSDKPTTIYDISPDGRFIAVTFYAYHAPDGSVETYCRVYDTTKNAFISDFIHHTHYYLKSHAVSGVDVVKSHKWLNVVFLDNHILATVSMNGEVLLWDCDKQHKLISWGGASQLANGVAFPSQYGTFVVSEENSRGHRGRISHVQYIGTKVKLQLPEVKESFYIPLREGYFLRLWDIKSGHVIREFECDHPVDKLVFSPDDRLLAGSSPLYSKEDRKDIWDVETGKKLQMLREPDSLVGFTSDSSYLVVHTNNTIKLWNIAKQAWHNVEHTVDGHISSCQINHDDKIVFVYQTWRSWQIAVMDVSMFIRGES